MSHTPELPETELPVFTRVRHQRDTYRDLCGELLEALKTTKMCVSMGLNVSAVHHAVTAITKAEKIMGDSNAN